MINFKQLTISDPTFFRPERYSALDRFFLGMIRDERDLPFIHFTLRISLTLIPLGVLHFFVQGWIWWLVTAVYFYLNHLYFKGPFGLMLHCVCHRPFFRKKYNFLNYYLPWVVAPFFGHTPETYFAHHIGMHHAENNLEEDTSSTMHFQRDSFRDFLRYFANFFFTGIFGLYNYHKERKRYYFLPRIVAGELAFYVMVIALSFIDFASTFMVFIFPFFVFRFVAMLGNWTQHSFVDGDDPGNHYKNSSTCINHKYNHKCWNDGYHISHHIKPTMHWTEHPDHLRRHYREYAENWAFVFAGLDFLGIFLLLMRKRYEVLAKHIVNIDDTFASEEEVIELMKARTQKIPKVVVEAV
jgi:hypothetical protein